MTEQRIYRFFPVLIALLAFVVFLPALHCDFVNWDDEANFLNNEAYRGMGWDQLRWMWTSHLTGHYIPLTWMTFGLDYRIWGMDPLGYHLTNILWHAANAVAFYFLALALFRCAIPANAIEAHARIPLGACFAALLFALHPLRAESVAWITERRDVVSGLFYLLAIVVYVRGVPDVRRRGIEPRRYWSCLALFTMGALSKEMVVTLPLVLLILDVYPLGRLGGGPGRWFGAEARRIWLEKVPFFAISSADSALTFYIGHQEKVMSLIPVTWFDRIAISIYGLAFYLWKTLLPFHLSPYYELTTHRLDPRAFPFLVSLAAVIGITTAAFYLRRKFPVLPAVTLAYAFTLIPVLGFFHNGHQIVADRYSYLACLGWALLAGGAMVRWTRAGVVPFAGGLVILALAGLTWRQVEVWRDSETLWSYTIASEPSFIAYVNLGKVLMDRGDYLWAADNLRKAISMKPDFATAHMNLGISLGNLGQVEEAAREFRMVLNLGGERRDLAESDLGIALARQGKLDEAIDHLREAVRINPQNELARHNLEYELYRRSLAPAMKEQEK
jgi:protein O-mannosyl-transferase